jgi:thiol-disulfide isomerase/thioredoxin
MGARHDALLPRDCGGIVRPPVLLAMILALAAIVGILHWKLKPEPTEKEYREAGWGMASRAAWEGRYAPDFELKISGGNTFKLSENVGKKIIVLNFFATWCGPCREEMPELNQYYKDHKDENFLLLAVDAEEKPEVVDGYVRELKLDFPAGVDEGPIRRQYSVNAFPTTVLVGIDGKVQLYETGAIANAQVAFDNLLKVNRMLSQHGMAVTAEEYKKQTAKQPPLLAPGPEQSKEEEGKLDERGKRIAAQMDCPCGCSDKVQACRCNTAAKIKKALVSEKFEGMTDAQVIAALNKRFCGGAM